MKLALFFYSLLALFFTLHLHMGPGCSDSACTGNFFLQGSHRLEKYLNLEGFLEKSMKIKYALKYWKITQSLEKSLIFKIFCRT